MTNTLSTSKFVAALVAVVMFFSLVFALPAKAATAEELQAQIQSLLATIASLQAQLSGMSGGTTTGGSSAACGFTFTENHKMGDRGGEVMNIQKFLNTDPATQVAATGAGSPGNETSYFGPATKAAVKKFQAKYASDILAPVGLTNPTGFWGPSSIAKANALSQASCSSTGTGSGTGSATAGTGVTVSAAAQPGNSLAPKGALNVPFTRFTLTAGASDVAVTGVKVKLQGLANRSNFTSVVLLDENGMQVGRTRVLQSDYTATIGEAMTIPAGTSKTFTVAANIAATVNPGEVAAFAVVAVDTTATVNGTLPIVGAQHTMNSTLTVATLTLANGANFPTITTKEIGSTGVIFGSVRATNNSSNEDVVLKAMRFYQAGSAANSDLANLKVMVDGTEYPVTVSADGKYYAVSFGSGITIGKGLSKDIDIKGDVVSGVNRTIQFQVYEASDVNAAGAMYGYGAPVTATFPKNVSTSAITITGATLNSLSRSNAAPAANITVAKPNEVLGAFEIDLKGEGVEVSTLEVRVDLKESNTNNDETGAITNVTLVDENGAVLAGPVDYTDRNTGIDAANSLDGMFDGKFTFSGVTFPVGKTTVYVKGQLSSSMLADGDAVQVSTNIANWSGIRGTVSGTNVTITGSATANPMTVRTAKLTLVTTANPSSQLIGGATNVLIATGELDATGSGDDIRVTTLSVKSIGNNSNATNALNNVRVMADMDDDGTYETQLAAPQSFTGTTATQTLLYTLDQTVEVPKGGKVKVAVYADIVASATGNVQVSFTAGSAVGKTTSVVVTASTAGSGVQRTFATSGTLVLSAGGDNPNSRVILDSTSSNSEPQTIAQFKASADNVEDVEIREVTFNNNVSGTNNNDRVIIFELYNGTSTSPIQTVANTGGNTLTFDLTSKNVIVEAGKYSTFTIKAKTADITAPSQNDTPVDITDATTGLSVVAKGVESQKSITVTPLDFDNDDKVYEAYPTITVEDKDTSKVLTPSSNMQVMKMTITNHGDKDITLTQGQGNKLSVTLRHHDASGSANVSSWKMTDGSLTLCSASSLSLAEDTDNQVQCNFASHALVIPANSSKSVYVYADSSGLTSSNSSISAKLLDANQTLEFSIDNTGNYNNIMNRIMDSDINGPNYITP